MSPLLGLHIAIVLLGMTGLFGKFLTISPAAIIFGRALFAVLVVGGLCVLLRPRLTVAGRRNQLLMLLSGVVLVVHWLTFFHAIQLSTVAIGLVGFATYPVFVMLLEPVLFAERYRKVDILTTALVVLGLGFVAPTSDLQHSQTLALAWAVLAGLLAAVLTLLNRCLVVAHHALAITWYQHLTACMLTAPLVWWLADWPDLGQWGLLALLGVVFTALPQLLLVHALNYVNAQFASVMVGLEPVYAIVFAVILLGEIPAVTTVVGGLCIVLAVLLATVNQRAHRQSA